MPNYTDLHIGSLLNQYCFHIGTLAGSEKIQLIFHTIGENMPCLGPIQIG